MKSEKSNLNQNCTVCASISWLYKHKIQVISNVETTQFNTELLVNMKMHWSLWKINFVELLSALDYTFTILLLGAGIWFQL